MPGTDRDEGKEGRKIRCSPDLRCQDVCCCDIALHALFAYVAHPSPSELSLFKFIFHERSKPMGCAFAMPFASQCICLSNKAA